MWNPPFVFHHTAQLCHMQLMTKQLLLFHGYVQRPGTHRTTTPQVPVSPHVSRLQYKNRRPDPHPRHFFLQLLSSHKNIRTHQLRRSTVNHNQPVEIITMPGVPAVPVNPSNIDVEVQVAVPGGGGIAGGNEQPSDPYRFSPAQFLYHRKRLTSSVYGKKQE